MYENRLSGDRCEWVGLGPRCMEQYGLYIFLFFGDDSTTVWLHYAITCIPASINVYTGENNK